MYPRKQLFQMLTACRGRYQSRCFSVSNARPETFTASDAIMPQPPKTKILSYLGGMITISVGMTTGALISKNIASFLEENDLFVPSDDDDDD